MEIHVRHTHGDDVALAALAPFEAARMLTVYRPIEVVGWGHAGTPVDMGFASLAFGLIGAVVNWVARGGSGEIFRASFDLHAYGPSEA